LINTLYSIISQSEWWTATIGFPYMQMRRNPIPQVVYLWTIIYVKLLSMLYAWDKNWIKSNYNNYLSNCWSKEEIL